MLKLTQELFGAEDPDIARMGEDQPMLEVLLDMVTYFTGLAGERRACPTDDLASVIANAELDGCPLADMDMLGHYVIIATAGHDTTSNAISGGLLALMEHPDQLALLQAQPELIDHAADEIIRYVSPVKHFMRNCQEPFTLRDVTFEPGDLALPLLRVRQPGRERVPRPDCASTSAARTRRATSPSASGATSASAPIWPAWRSGRSSGSSSGGSSTSSSAADATWIQANFVQGPKSIPITYRFR